MLNVSFSGSKVPSGLGGRVNAKGQAQKEPSDLEKTRQEIEGKKFEQAFQDEIMYRKHERSATENAALRPLEQDSTKLSDLEQTLQEIEGKKSKQAFQDEIMYRKHERSATEEDPVLLPLPQPKINTYIKNIDYNC